MKVNILKKTHFKQTKPRFYLEIVSFKILNYIYLYFIKFLIGFRKVNFREL